jgi:hypothetical protein
VIRTEELASKRRFGLRETIGYLVSPGGILSVVWIESMARNQGNWIRKSRKV